MLSARGKILWNRSIVLHNTKESCYDANVVTSGHHQRQHCHHYNSRYSAKWCIQTDGGVITRSNITWYSLQHCNNSGIILSQSFSQQTPCFTMFRPDGRALGDCCEGLTLPRYNDTALYFVRDSKDHEVMVSCPSCFSMVRTLRIPPAAVKP